jgi:hypothetical protein
VALSLGELSGVISLNEKPALFSLGRVQKGMADTARQGQASTDKMQAQVKKYEAAVENASSNIAKAKRREEDATAKVAAAEASLASARSKHASDSEQVIRAQDRLASAHRRVKDAQDNTARSTRTLQQAQDRLADTMSRSSNRISVDFEKMSQNVARAGSRGGRAFTQAFLGVTGGLSAITPAVGAAGAAMVAGAGNAVTFAASLSSLAGVAALVPAGLMAAGAGAGVLITALSGMGDALKEANAAATGGATGNPRLAAMAVEDAMMAITVAEENAADSAESSSRRIADAKRALGEVVTAVAEAQKAAAKAVEMAERDEAKAARDVIEAQKDLAEAREEAAEKVDAVGRKAFDADRKAVDTAINYRAAVEAYNKAVEDGVKGDKLAQLDNNVAKAMAADDDAKQAVIDLGKEHKAAQAEAIDANEKVLKAEQRLTDARQAQADAIQDRKDAQADVLKQEQEGAQRIADAQQAITDATKQAEKAQTDSARAVEQAHRNLERVQMQQADTAAQAGAKSTEAMDKLTPSAREAVRALLQVKEQLGGIRRIAQENFFKGFSAPLLSLAGSVMPQLATGVGAIASALGSGARLFMGSVEKALGGGVLESLLMGVADSTAILNTGINPLVASFTTLGVVGMKYMPRLAQSIADAAGHFDGFIQAAAADGRLDRWIEDGIRGMKDLWSIAGSVSGIFSALNKAAEAGGAVATLSGMAAALRNVEAIMQGPVFQTTMATIFSGAEKGAQGLLAALGPIGDAFVRGAPAMAEFLRLGGLIAGTFLGGVFTALSDPAFGAGLVTFMEGLQVGVEATAPHLPGMASAFGSLLTSLAPIAEVVGPALVQVLTFMADGFASAIQFLSPLLVLIAGSPTAMGILIGVFTAATIAAGVFSVAMAIQRVIVIGAWALMSAQALIHGARMALAWIIALGPIAWVIAAVVALAALIILNWDKISMATRLMWEKHVKPHLDTFHKFINETLPAAFKFGMGIIEEQWNKLIALSKVPVKFVIQKVINEGLIDGLNGVGKLMGLNPLEHVKLPAGFSRGGVLPGYEARKRDTVLTPMRPGEGVLVPEVVRGAGRGFIDTLNAAGNRGIGAVRNLLANGFHPGRAEGGLIHPLPGAPVSSGFGPRAGGVHNGIDFAAAAGTPVRAAGPGRVSMAGWSSGGGGNEVHVDHPNGLQTWYSHLSSFAVKLGDMVNAGTRLGGVGTTGNSTGNHLHYMVLKGGWPNYVNPAGYLEGGGDIPAGGAPWNPIAGIVDGLVGKFKESFPGAGFIADLAIGAGKKILDGAVAFVTGQSGTDKNAKGNTTGAPTVYDGGGWLENTGGPQLVQHNKTKPDAVLTYEELQMFKAAAKNNLAGGVSYSPTYQYLGEDPHEVMRRDKARAMDMFNALTPA